LLMSHVFWKNFLWALNRRHFQIKLFYYLFHLWCWRICRGQLFLLVLYLPFTSNKKRDTDVKSYLSRVFLILIR
jgi:hypothetical protein